MAILGELFFLLGLLPRSRSDSRPRPRKSGRCCEPPRSGRGRAERPAGRGSFYRRSMLQPSALFVGRVLNRFRQAVGHVRPKRDRPERQAIPRRGLSLEGQDHTSDSSTLPNESTSESKQRRPRGAKKRLADLRLSLLSYPMSSLVGSNRLRLSKSHVAQSPRSSQESCQ